MVAAPPERPSGTNSPDDSTFVCPFCGTRFDEERRTCGACASNLVVPVDDGTVYETIMAMCDCSRTVPRQRE